MANTNIEATLNLAKEISRMVATQDAFSEAMALFEKRKPELLRKITKEEWENLPFYGVGGKLDRAVARQGRHEVNIENFFFSTLHDYSSRYNVVFRDVVTGVRGSFDIAETFLKASGYHLFRPERLLVEENAPKTIFITTSVEKVPGEDRYVMHHVPDAEQMKAWVSRFKECNEVLKRIEDRDGFVKAIEDLRTKRRLEETAAPYKASHAYSKIIDGVPDDPMHSGLHRNGGKHVQKRSADPRAEDGVNWLANYDGSIVEPEQVPEGLTGMVTDVHSIVYGTKLPGIGKNGGTRGTPESKLVLAVTLSAGVTVMVNVRGALHRSIGRVTDQRVMQLRTHLPKEPICVTDEASLVRWFREAGLKKAASTAWLEKKRAAANK